MVEESSKFVPNHIKQSQKEKLQQQPNSESYYELEEVEREIEQKVKGTVPIPIHNFMK